MSQVYVKAYRKGGVWEDPIYDFNVKIQHGKRPKDNV